MISEETLAFGKEHCERLTWFWTLPSEDERSKGRVQGETYCHRCPRIPLIGTHCCLNLQCEEEIKEAKAKYVEQWNKFHPDQPLKLEEIK